MMTALIITLSVICVLSGFIDCILIRFVYFCVDKDQNILTPL